MRISGVKVGKVKTKELDRAATRTEVVLEIEPRYAPLPADTRAILRQKTLLGETYVELTPGTRAAATIDDGGTLARGQVADTVELDEIFRVVRQADARGVPHLARPAGQGLRRPRRAS